MAGDSIPRSEFAVYLNTTPESTATYVLVGDGITSGTVNYNPQTSEETYIHETSGTTEVESYRPTLPIEAVCKNGDAAWEFVEALRRSRAVLDDAKTDIIMVYLYETPTTGDYPAEKQDVSIQIDDFGGDGGAKNMINYTINFIGDPVQGDFNPTTATWTPDA